MITGPDGSDLLVEKCLLEYIEDQDALDEALFLYQLFEAGYLYSDIAKEPIGYLKTMLHLKHTVTVNANAKAKRDAAEAAAKNRPNYLRTSDA